jgi:mRNA-degrading endonuclease toxin of MazEF toxin-antitoxin module
MANFSQGDVIKVPFPYIDRSTRQSRPALVVSTKGIEDAHGLLWVAMITSAENRGWSGDVNIGNYQTAGRAGPVTCPNRENRDHRSIGRYQAGKNPGIAIQTGHCEIGCSPWAARNEQIAVSPEAPRRSRTISLIRAGVTFSACASA